MKQVQDEVGNLKELSDHRISSQIRKKKNHRIQCLYTCSYVVV